MENGSARPPSLSEWIADALTDEIIAGELAPGTVLRESEVAERFSTSRGPCREAFSILARRGFLQTAPYRANIVSQLAASEIRELTECRLLLDPAVTTLAAERATPAQRKRLNELAELAESAARAGHRSAFYKALRDIRVVLLEASSNRFIRQVAETITHQVDRLRITNLDTVDSLNLRARRMHDIINAVVGGEGSAAAELMRLGIIEAEKAALQTAALGASSHLASGEANAVLHQPSARTQLPQGQ